MGPPSWRKPRGDALDCLTLAERNALLLYARAQRIHGRLTVGNLKELALALGLPASNLSNRYHALEAETRVEDEIVRIRAKVAEAVARRVRSRPVEPEHRRKENEMEDRADLAVGEEGTLVEAPSPDGYLQVDHLERLAEETLVRAIDLVTAEIEEKEAQRERIQTSLNALLEGRGEPPSEPSEPADEVPAVPVPEEATEPETAGEDIESLLRGEPMEITGEQLRSGMVAEGLGKVLDVSRESDETTVVIFSEADGTWIYENDEPVTVFVPETMVEEIRGELEKEPEPEERLDEKGDDESEPDPAERLDEKEATTVEAPPTLAEVEEALRLFASGDAGQEIWPVELRGELGIATGTQKTRLTDRLRKLAAEGKVEKVSNGRHTRYLYLAAEEGGDRPSEAGDEKTSPRLEDIRDWVVANRKDGSAFTASEVADALDGRFESSLTAWNEVLGFLNQLEARDIIRDIGGGEFVYVRPSEIVPYPPGGGSEDRGRSEPVAGTGRKLATSVPR